MKLLREAKEPGKREVDAERGAPLRIGNDGNELSEKGRGEGIDLDLIRGRRLEGGGVLEGKGEITFGHTVDVSES